MSDRTLEQKIERWYRRRRIAGRHNRWKSVRDVLIYSVAASLFLVLILKASGVPLGTMSIVQIMCIIPLLSGLSLLDACTRRIGRERYCARCGYPMPWVPREEHDLEDRCPECGNRWRLFKGHVRGRRFMHPAPLAAGVILIILPLLPHVSMLMSPHSGGILYRLMPTRALIAVAIDDHSPSIHEWGEISRRTLSPEQEEQLVERLLDQRTRRGDLASISAREWLENAVLSGRLPPELVERYLAEAVVTRITAPESARVGDRIQIRLTANKLRTTARRLTLSIAFGGFEIGDEIVPRARMESLLYAARVGQDWPQTEYIAHKPGPLRVQAGFWIIAQPPGPGRVLQWNEDGSPRLMPGAIQSSRIDISATISIDE